MRFCGHTLASLIVGIGCLIAAGCDDNGGAATIGTSGGSGGSGNPGTPSGTTSCANISSVGAAKGTVSATIDGSVFNGGVPAGASFYVPVAPLPAQGIPALDFFRITAECGDNTALTISAPAHTGVIPAGVESSGARVIDPQSRQPVTTESILQYRSTTVAGTYVTSPSGGTGTYTITSVSTTSVAGTFSLTMVPQAGTLTTGTRTVTGTFNVSF